MPAMPISAPAITRPLTGARRNSAPLTMFIRITVENSSATMPEVSSAVA